MADPVLVLARKGACPRGRKQLAGRIMIRRELLFLPYSIPWFGLAPLACRAELS